MAFLLLPLANANHLFTSTKLHWQNKVSLGVALCQKSDRRSEEEEDDALSTKFAKKQRFALEKHGGAERPENKSVNIDGIDTQNTGNAA